MGCAPDDLTDAMVSNLTKAQLPNGSFLGYDRRPPMEEGQIISTAMAMGALRHYPQPIKSVDLEPVFARGWCWLAKVEPKDPNQPVFPLLGLGWAGAKPSELKRHVHALLDAQCADGGWAPPPGLTSDAWATGMTLFVLHEVGGIAAADEHYGRGVECLLCTQFTGGLWFVPSRTWPFQLHFDSGFSHVKDHWISASGTAWAARASLNGLEATASNDNIMNTQVLMVKYPRPASDAPTAAKEPEKATALVASADPVFTRDILPIFQQSCVACHGGERPKVDLSVEAVAALLQGGQSGEPAIAPGNAEASPLICYVTDQLEGLKMPPLGIRTKYLALTSAQVNQLKYWTASQTPR